MAGLGQTFGRMGRSIGAAVALFTVFTTGAQAQDGGRCAAAPERAAASYNYVLGTQAIGSQYHFGDGSPLIEQAEAIRGFGSNLLKISLGDGAAEGYGTGRAMRGARSVLEYVEDSREIQQAFDMDFTYFQAWVPTYTSGEWRDGVTRREAAAYYYEMYNLAEWLLERYSGSGKVFMLGNWEGDWLLHGNGGRDSTPSDEAIEGMTEWLNIRQLAIDNARANVPHENVEIYHYVEVNLVEKAMRGEASMAHSVLPNIDVDLVSYSSYEAIKRSQEPDLESIREPLTAILDYLEGQLRPRPGLPFSRRVFIGEFGYHANRERPRTVEAQFLKTRYVMQVALELDLPFALSWQLYNNEYSPEGVSREMSLIDESGSRRALYYLHSEYLRQMHTFVAGSCQETGVLPTNLEFRTKALDVLSTLTFEDMQAMADAWNAESRQGA